MGWQANGCRLTRDGSNTVVTIAWRIRAIQQHPELPVSSPAG